MRHSNGHRIVAFEYPRLSTRTILELRSLQSAGFEVAVVHGAKSSAALAEHSFDSVVANVGLGHRLQKNLQRRLNQADASNPRSLARASVAEAALGLPTPQIRQRYADLNVLTHEWLAVAEEMTLETASVLWAADLDSLPAAVWAARARRGPRVVFDAHELFTRLDYLDRVQVAAWENIAQEFIPQADLVLTVGTEIADTLKRDYGATRVEVLLNRAEPTTRQVTPLRRRLTLEPDAPLAVHIGNISRNRRPEAAIDLLSRIPELNVVLLGENRLRQDLDLRSLAADAGVNNRLHLLPPVPANELVGTVADANLSLILYSPSTSDNLRLAMPNKLFDSLAAGVPVVAARGTAAGQFVLREGVGAVYDDSDPSDLARAVRNCLRGTEWDRQLHSRGEEFSWPAGEQALVKSVFALAEEAHLVSVPASLARDQPSPTVVREGREASNAGQLPRVRAGLARRLHRLAEAIHPGGTNQRGKASPNSHRRI